jgi:NAD(P)-dependent dehydrogenase (short-subunit alcohol dehydrogenase family)
MTGAGSMHGRTAVVTGASSGIGRATAALLASRGANVALLAPPDDRLEQAREEAAAYGTRVAAVPVDVTDSRAVAAAFAAAEQLGEVDAVFNNAGISLVAPITEFSDDDWHRLVATNLSGSFFVAREAARLMQPRRRGALVATASELALIGQSGYVAYTATKGGILAMTRALAAELAPSGIRVNALCPGATWTAQFQAEIDGALNPAAELAAAEASIALGRVGQAQEIAQGAAFLLSDDASYLTGTQLVIDGGRTTCVPVTTS